MFFGHTENFILRYYVWFSQIRSHLLLLSQSRDHIKHVVTCLASEVFLVLHAVFVTVLPHEGFCSTRKLQIMWYFTNVCRPAVSQSIEYLQTSTMSAMTLCSAEHELNKMYNSLSFFA